MLDEFPLGGVKGDDLHLILPRQKPIQPQRPERLVVGQERMHDVAVLARFREAQGGDPALVATEDEAEVGVVAIEFLR